jgi:glycosyltransferase involved in cell wall biosynthesis
MYEQYTHYVPIDSEAIKRFAIQMAVEYCNLCTHVVAPSESVARLLGERGVTTPVSSIPTGIDTDLYASGNSSRARAKYGIEQTSVVVGHVGRLAAEKNLEYLARAVQRFLDIRQDAVFLLVGSGESADRIKESLRRADAEGRLKMPGCLTGQDLTDAYAAMDVFAFSSHSETQGMVLAEAMAAGAAAVALDAPGAREIVNHANGRLLACDASEEEFAQALQELTSDRELLRQFQAAALETSRDFSIDATADRMLDVYEGLLRDHEHGREGDPGPWDRLRGRLEIEWNLLIEKTSAIVAAAREGNGTSAELK